MTGLSRGRFAGLPLRQPSMACTAVESRLSVSERRAPYRLGETGPRCRSNLGLAVILSLLLARVATVSEPVSAASASSVTLTAMVVATNDTQAKAYLAAFAKYEQAHPGIQIKATTVSDPFTWQNKVLALTAAGTPPDIMWLWGINFRNLAGQGLLLPIDRYVDSQFLQAYYPNAVQASRYEGKLYALPGLMGCLAILENLDQFDERGVLPLAQNDTWDTFLTKAKKLTMDSNGDGTPERYGFVWYALTVRDWMTWVWRNGGDLLDASRTHFLLGKQPAAEALQFLADLSNRYKVTPPGSVLTGMPWTYFENEQAAMYPTGPWDLLVPRKFHFDVGPYPIRKNQAVALDVFYMAVHSQTRHPDQAVDVARWVTHTFEGEGALFSSGFGIPTIREYALSYFVNPKTPWHEEVFLMPLEAGEARMLPYVDRWNDLETLLRNAYTDVWQGKDSAQHLAEVLTPKVEALLK
ncbi:MAG: sugar ABC transporter substrate-binding protein [Limnochordaceae bacterium]|nr:sugar ABC transporter substrate-binding protein [Limnochordaceae bacterium]